MYKNRKKMEKFEQINIPYRKQLGTNNGLSTRIYKSAFFCA